MADPIPADPAPAPAPTPEPAPVDPAPDPEPLGEGGKAALAAERKARADAEKAAKALQKRLDDIEALNMTEQDRAVAAARAEGMAEAQRAASERILRTELRAAATGKLADPSDALAHIDLSTIDVSDDGTVDTDAIASAIDALVAAKPYLAGATPTPPPPGVPTGARPGTSEVPQLDAAAVKAMTPDQIVEAKAKGQLNDLLGIK